MKKSKYTLFLFFIFEKDIGLINTNWQKNAVSIWKVSKGNCYVLCDFNIHIGMCLKFFNILIVYLWIKQAPQDVMH